jgi:hypothetical protein
MLDTAAYESYAAQMGPRSVVIHRGPPLHPGDVTTASVQHLSRRCYTSRGMPTTRPRLTITETDDVAAALDAAAARWPEVSSRRELLLRLVEQGREVIENERDDAVDRRRAAIRRTSGALTGAYDAGYLDRLRDDWPA